MRILGEGSSMAAATRGTVAGPSGPFATAACVMEVIDDAAYGEWLILTSTT